jgi:hypothetical protein
MRDELIYQNEVYVEFSSSELDKVDHPRFHRCQKKFLELSLLDEML